MPSIIGKLNYVAKFSSRIVVALNKTSVIDIIRKFHLYAGCSAGIKVEMPSLSPTMERGTIVKWHKGEGDKVSPGDVLCDIQTDKAVVGMEYDDDGILAKILKPDNSADVQVGQLIALMVEDGQNWTDVAIPTEAAANTSQPLLMHSHGGTSPEQHHHHHQAHSQPDIKPVNVGPSVRRLLNEFSLAVNLVAGTGPKSNLLKGDVLHYITSEGLKKVDAVGAGKTLPAASPVTPAIKDRAIVSSAASSLVDRGSGYVDLPLSSIRSVIAKRLTESKITIPHAYASIDCAMTGVISARRTIIGHGLAVSVNDFIIKAAGHALEKCPKLNATVIVDTVRIMDGIDISVAIATPGGLITPIVEDVPSLGIDEVASKVRDLTERAKNGKLQPHEFQGGSFCISNLGMFGIKEFSAVINPPQVAILAVGAMRHTVGEDNAIAGPHMTVTLSFDSRVIDEVEACTFLETFRLALCHPEIMLGGRIPMWNQDAQV